NPSASARARYFRKAAGLKAPSAKNCGIEIAKRISPPPSTCVWHEDYYSWQMSSHCSINTAGANNHSRTSLGRVTICCFALFALWARLSPWPVLSGMNEQEGPHSSLESPRGQESPPRSGNPILPGWYADPEARVFQNEYWIYPTYSAPYDQQVFIDAFSSKDLIDWKKHSRVLDIADVHWARRALWAPSVVEKSGWYYLFFGANDIQNDTQLG